MEVAAFAHVAVGISDMERSIVFYGRVLGLRLDMDAEESSGLRQAGQGTSRWVTQ